VKYRKLGTTGIEVSEFALGTWPFAGDHVWGDQRDEDSIAAVHTALDNGVNFIDTAEGYGNGRAERVLGQALEGRRADVVIASKVADRHLRPEQVQLSCEGSLSKLGTDYIDLYLIHWPNREVPLADTVGTLERLKQEGKIRYFGVSNFGVKDLSDILELTSIEIDQLPYNLVWRPVEYEILPFCRQNGIGLMVYSPLMQGILTGRYPTADDVPEGLARSRHFSPDRPMSEHGDVGMEDELFEAVRAVSKIADEIGHDPATVSLAWLRREPAVTSLLIGARTGDEALMNLAAFEFDLPDDAANALEDATADIKKRLGADPDMWRYPGRMR
jgi:aryl-alcohol dehydrogenase-like predicted oxidoreductase